MQNTSAAAAPLKADVTSLKFVDEVPQCQGPLDRLIAWTIGGGVNGGRTY
jgi:hypothetical protein